MNIKKAKNFKIVAIICGIFLLILTTNHVYAANKKINIKNTTVTLSKTSYEYTGDNITPTPVIKYKGNQLKLNVDYSLSYKNNKNISRNATITITGKGKYEGTVSQTFTITQRDLSKAVIEMLRWNTFTYTSNAIKPIIRVIKGNKVLTEGTDYKISYNSVVNAGTGTVIVTAIGNNNRGCKTKTFTIKKASISKAQITLSQSQFSYDGNEKKPSVTIKYNGNIYLFTGELMNKFDAYQKQRAKLVEKNLKKQGSIAECAKIILRRILRGIRT